MANETIKGINVVIGSDTTGLSAALADVNKSSQAIQSELSKVEKLLKFNPKDTDLLAQKQKLLGDQVATTKEKLDRLKSVQEQINQQFAKGEIGEGQYRAFQREVVATETKLQNLKKTLADTGFNVDEFGKKMQVAGDKMEKSGKTLTKGVTAPIVAISAVSGKASVDFESAFAGVIKTVDATDAELAVLSQGIRDMANEIPVAVEEISGVSEAAGQLGIQNQNILGFTRVMSDMGVATNLSANDAATALARLANITQMPQTEFDRLGSVIVALGNNLATTESEIVEMGLRLAGAGSQVGMTEAQILSFAGALSSVGIEAEAGGSAFSKVMVEMQLATETGGTALNNFASVAGMSAEQFRQAFKEDAATAITAFITGLGQAESKGTTAIKILDDMGITEVRLRDSLLRAAGAGDLFSNSLELGTQAWQDNIALTKEAEQRYGTSESRLKIMWNQLKDVAITLGDAIVPAVLDFLDAIKPLINAVTNAVKWFASLDTGAQRVILVLAGLAAAIGPVLIGAGNLITAVGKIAPIISSLSKTWAVLNAVMVANPFLLVVAAVAALTTAGILLWKNWDAVRGALLNIWDGIVYGVQQAVSYLKTLVFSYIKLWVDSINIVGQYIPGLNKALESAQTTIQGWIESEKNAIQYRREERAETEAQKKALKESEQAIKDNKAATDALTQSENKLATAKNNQTLKTAEQIKADEDLKKQRQDFENQWNQRLLELNEQYSLSRTQNAEEEAAAQLEILQRHKEAALLEAGELGAKRQAILDYFALEEQKLRDKQTEAQRAAFESAGQTWLTFVQTAMDGSKGFKEAVKEMVIGLISALQQQVIASAAAAEALSYSASFATFGASLGHLAVIAAKVLPKIAMLEALKVGISALANGAMVTGPTLALVGEGQSKEAVLPLNRKVLGGIGQDIAEYMPQGNDGQGLTVNLHVHGNVIGDKAGMRKLAQEVFSYEYSVKRRLGGAES